MLNKKTSIRTGILLSVMVLPLLAFAQEFTPLTNLPGLADVKNSNTLPAFLNQLYKLCIGAAAVIAVLQIMRAGTKYFFYTGSVTQNQEAKKLIMNSLAGLLLVLSPAIVFGIINPDILNLKLDFKGLEPEKIATTTSSTSGLQERMCSAFDRKQAVPDQENQRTAYECQQLGSGWTTTDQQCCNISGNAQVCCGYSRAEDENLQPKPPPDPEDNESGSYRIEYVKSETDYDSNQPNARCLVEGTERYNTQQECQTALGQLSGAAARHTCTDGRTEAYTPSQQEYERVNQLPSC